MAITPRLSVITINYNNRDGLLRTIESVTRQSFDSFEFIIIDGGSQDNSLQVIEPFTDKIKYWVSERDNGIYHAMNKGILQAEGEYLLFVNSGDHLVNPEVLQKVFSINPAADVVYGNLQTEHRMLTYPAHLDFTFFFRSSIGHMSSFIRRSLFDKLGLYNENNKIVSDWEFFIKAIILNDASYHYINETITFFNSEGVSNSPGHISLHRQERLKVLAPLFPLYYNELLESFDNLENELCLYKSSRTLKWVKRIMNSKAYRAIKP